VGRATVELRADEFDGELKAANTSHATTGIPAGNASPAYFSNMHPTPRSAVCGSSVPEEPRDARVVPDHVDHTNEGENAIDRQETDQHCTQHASLLLPEAGVMVHSSRQRKQMYDFGGTAMNDNADLLAILRTTLLLFDLVAR